MAMGYEEIKELISETLTNRPKGTEITPETHQELEMQLLEYIRSIELTSNTPFIDIATADTDPVQPDDARVCYIATLSPSERVTFTNFHKQNGSAITITASTFQSCIVFLIWNTAYWESEIITLSSLGIGKVTPEGGEIFNDYVNNKANQYAHAEGYQCEASGQSSHAEGYNTQASGEQSHAEGRDTIATGNQSHAEGYNTRATGYQSHAEGYNTQATTYQSHAEGQDTEASGFSSHAEGRGTIAVGYQSHAEGYNTQATGRQSHAENEGTEASGERSHAEGYNTKAQGSCSHTGGANTEASGKCAFAHGVYAVAPNYAQVSIGAYNERDSSPSGTSYNTTKPAFVIGNGASENARSDAFKILGNGTVYADNTTIQPMADYAEMFEWVDGNPDEEDRIGYFVALQGNKIKKATGTNGEYILGIISGTAAIIGDAPMRWNNKYLTDEWGRPVYETVEYTENENRIKTDDEGNPVLDENGNYVTETVSVKKQAYVRKLNPEYNPELNYIPREQRPEWGIVGLLGKVLVRQDGSLVAGEYCMPNENGIAVKSDTGFYVLEVLNETQAKVLLK